MAMLLGYERRCLAAVFATTLPSGTSERVPLGAADVDLDRFIEDVYRHAPRHFCWGLRACIWFVLLAPPFVLGRFRTFLGLSGEDRVRLLERLGQSSSYVVREMPLLFKTVACLGFCGLPQVQARIGISPLDSSAPEWARPRLPVARTP